MNFYRSKNRKKFIATESNRCAIVSKSASGANVQTYNFPFVKLNGEVYEESTADEFFEAYDELTMVMTDISSKSKKTRGLQTLLEDAKVSSYK